VALSLALLLFTGVVGIHNGITERSTGANNLQRSVTADVFFYSALGLITAFGLLRRRKWSVRAAIAWGIVITWVPGADHCLWRPDPPWISAIAASVITPFIATVVVWTALQLSR
jgi:hypothetical protein